MAENLESDVEISKTPDIVKIEIPKLNENIEKPAKRQYNKRNKNVENLNQNSNTNSKKSGKNNSDDYENISTLIKTGFTVVSLRAGEQWNIDDNEANSIAKPLSKILEKYNLIEKLEKVSDPVALIVATGTVVMPRLIMTLNLNKEKEGEKKKNDANSTNGIQRTEQERNNVGNDTNVNSSSVEPTTANYESNQTAYFSIP